MRGVFLYLTLLFTCSTTSFGQTNPKDTLFTIDNTVFSSETFLKLYRNKQFLDQNKQLLSLHSALNQYINYQLKLAEANHLRLDTLPAVKKEINKYQNLAFEPYLYPIHISEDQILEAFKRIQYFLRIRHILIKIKRRKTPKDTLEAYNIATNIYTQLKNGKRFEKLAKQHSDDLSVRINNGEIGYLTAFDMDYSFENAAYNLQVGEISKPVRTQFGYHIIQVLERVPNPGQRKIERIILKYPKKADRSQRTQIQHKADSLFKQLKNGANFKNISLQYSTEKNPPQTLRWFGLYEMSPEIEHAAFQLKQKKEISSPIKTEMGYQILQLVDKKDYSDIDACRDELIKNLLKDSRSRPSRAELISRIKKEYHYTENKNLLSNFYSILDYAYADLWEPIFSIDSIKYTQEDFAKFLSLQASKDIYENFKEYINRLFINFSNNSILAFYKNKISEREPRLRKLITNYKNGVLVYFINKQYIWDLSKNKEEEIKHYYLQNQKKYGNTVDYNQIKNQIASDYRRNVEKNWMSKLKSRYVLKINQATLHKIAIKNND
ncbi:peptidylprolyl isomerase [Ancylomarina longa]|uniref:PpiC domain-containing protein n=1 Tax=Ancylomarina longa TaxID=2487017 RepID=A0A434AGE4_9BACT|nr:peptidylprolyl isomerase [Ancylomarina longa]RUT73442.1 hypothetical protein DLK05_13255 [Ancylomarina longa]